MAGKPRKLSLGLNLDDYYFEARHCDGQTPCRWIEYNYVQGVDFSWGCPAWKNQGFDAYGAAGKCNIVYYLLMGKLDYADEGLRDIVYRDPLCGRCDAACKRCLDLEIELMLESLRARMVEKGYGPMPAHVEITQNIEKTGNRYGKSQTRRLDWVPADARPASRADILYFVGCRASLVDTGIAKATARIIAAAGEKYMVMKDEQCCGHLVFITGQVEKAKKLAKANLDAIRKTGAKKVVFSCAEGYKTIKVDYPKLLGFSTEDLGFEPVHITELAAPWVKEGRLKFNKRFDMRLTYHDPCNLGRKGEKWVKWEGIRENKFGAFVPPREFVRRGVHGVYEPPRDILKAIPGVQLVEMVRHHDNGYCCGADGGVKEAFPDVAISTAAERLAEAAHVGAEAIVTACPYCRGNFNDAKKDGMKVFDITEVMARAIGK
ncbi:MAG: (Fe-S)-binding protein [Chloroflexota bacterium]